MSLKLREKGPNTELFSDPFFPFLGKPIFYLGKGYLNQLENNYKRIFQVINVRLIFMGTN